jgi:alkaline phosphatase
MKFLAFVLAYVATTTVKAKIKYEYKTLDYDFDVLEDTEAPRNVIMMIPDGTGPNVFTMARTIIDPTLKTRLHIDPLLMGTIQTHSTTSLITDSAAAATAYSTGYKTYDAAIAVDNATQPLGTILEAAKARGMVTGMIVTSRVTHATPASFAAHIHERDLEDEIATQYVNNKNLDFLLGGGARHFKAAQLEDLKASGYTVVKDYRGLLEYKDANEKSGNLRIFGLFAKSHMSYEVDRLRMEEENPGNLAREPSLPEMVDAILSIIKNNPQAKKNGFFLMIEGSRVDHAGHSNDPGTMAKEAIAFDETVAVVKDFVHNVKNTAMISAADHGTGGMTLGRDGIYAWKPQALQEQKMSTEYMNNQLTKTLMDCGSGSNDTCKDKIFAGAVELIKGYSTLTELPEIYETEFKEHIAKAVDKTNDFYDLMISMGHALSEPALINWTTVGHVGTDVNLYCMGPSIFERLCKGVHENTYVNKIMRTYLNLNLQKETLRRRGFQVDP